jgi:hypothetical protein
MPAAKLAANLFENENEDDDEYEKTPNTILPPGSYKFPAIGA